METWKPILGFESLYEASDYGNIRRVSRGKIFSADDVKTAKQKLAEGETLKNVAAFLKCSIQTVFSIKHGKTWCGDSAYRAVKPRFDKAKYLQFAPCKNGKSMNRSVHRAVWEAFNGPIPGRLEVNHKNLDRSDNRLENLELLTHQQNVQHAMDIYRTEPSSRQPTGKKGSYRGRYFKHT